MASILNAKSSDEIANFILDYSMIKISKELRFKSLG